MCMHVASYIIIIIIAYNYVKNQILMTLCYWPGIFITRRFLHQNLIKRVENLDHLQNLDTLNLSNNQLTHLENLR